MTATTDLGLSICFIKFELRETRDWQTLLVCGKFSPVAVAHHSKAARAYTDGRFGVSHGDRIQVFIFRL